MYACPRCGESSQVLNLPEFWRSLSQDAELKRSLAQPPAYVAQWSGPVIAAVLAVLAFSNGSIGIGLVVAVVSVVSFVWVQRAAAAAQEARDRWAALLYCRRCPAQFLPSEAKVL